MSVTVYLNPPGLLPSGYCWSGPQQYLNDIAQLLSVTFSGLDIIISDSAPAAEDQDKLWARLVGGYLEGIYAYSGGWYRANQTPPTSGERRLWMGTEASVWSYDGGDGTDPGISSPTLTTGAMWEVDHTFDFKIPIGPGTNATTYDGQAATVIAQGDTGGAERVAILNKEMPNHTHTVPLYQGDATNHANRINTTDELVAQDLNYQSGATGGDSGDQHTWHHQNLPPYVGCFFIKRTSRQFIQAV